MKPILEIDNLAAHFHTRRGVVKAVDGISYTLHVGETLGMVGESGSGKSVSQLSYLGLLPSPPLKIESGSVKYRGENLLEMSTERLQKLRGDKIAMIFQEPMTSLNPYLKIKTQLIEPLVIHRNIGKKEAEIEAQKALERVGISDLKRTLKAYPHEFSGGMRQRVMIAMALTTKPDVLIADEPTTALDVTVQAQILELLKSIQKETRMSMVLITHDLGVVAGMADRVVVMNGGKVVESGTVDDIFTRSKHPYTASLLAATPRLDTKLENGLSQGDVACKTVAQIHQIKVDYQTTGGWLRAVQNISLDVREGEILGLVGESGCGKSSLGRAVIRLVEPTSGKVEIDGKDFLTLQGESLRTARRNIQMVFQDPYGSLDPRMPIRDILEEPLWAHAQSSPSEIDAKVTSAIEQVGLTKESLLKYPHEFSGGQRQRIAIARALILDPKILIADEPVSSLDVSVQAQILKLLKRIQRERTLSMIFVSHNLAVVRQIADRIAVMYLGRIVELATARELFENAKHPYTKALISAVPIPNPALERLRKRQLLTGEIPSPVHPPPGCAFSTRCPIVAARCRSEVPVLHAKSPLSQAACFEV